MEKKNNTSKGLIIALIVISSLFLLTIIGLVIFVAYSFVRPNKIEGKRIVVEKDTNTNTNTTKKSLIKDESKDIVYENPKYSPWVEAPYINIDSEDAKKLNNEIDEYYSKVTKDYYEVLTYKYYENDDVVSIVTKMMQAGANKDYRVYNINKKTGKEVTASELMKSKNLSLSSIKIRMKAIWMQKVKTSEGYSMPTNSNPNKSVEAATKDNIEQLTDDDIVLYLNSDGHLCVIYEEYQIAGAETGNYIMDLDKYLYTELK